MSERRGVNLGVDARSKPWRRDILLVAALGLILIGVIGLKAINTANDVQEAREDAIRTTCQETNERHDNTIEALDDALDRAEHLHPAQAEQIERSRTFTVLLINALVPKQDCEQRVGDLT